MSEFCAGVKILLERMKSNPEDFDLLEHNVANMIEIRGKFYFFGKNMEHLLVRQDKQTVLDNWPDWHYFTKEEQDALIAGFKEMKRAKFDKEIMERVFDETYVQRQRDFHSRNSIPSVRTSPAQNNVNTVTTTNNATGLLSGLGLGGLFGGSGQ